MKDGRNRPPVDTDVDCSPTRLVPVPALRELARPWAEESVSETAVSDTLTPGRRKFLWIELLSV